MAISARCSSQLRAARAAPNRLSRVLRFIRMQYPSRSQNKSRTCVTRRLMKMWTSCVDRPIVITKIAAS